jgi:lipoprotein-releasing system permease protein
MMGVAIGVMALIVVMAVMSGFDLELREKIVGIQPHVIIQKYPALENYESVKQKIESLNLPKLQNVQAYVEGQGIIRSFRASGETLFHPLAVP